MATYTQISRQEMENFLLPKGFQEIKLDLCYERVYAKIIKINNATYSLRIYSSIVEENSRQVGADAIRLCIFWRKNTTDKPIPIGKATRIHRVKGWKNNLQNRLDHIQDMIGPTCKNCGAPTKLRNPQKGQNWKPFYGCVLYKTCKFSKNCKLIEKVA